MNTKFFIVSPGRDQGKLWYHECSSKTEAMKYALETDFDSIIFEFPVPEGERVVVTGIGSTNGN